MNKLSDFNQSRQLQDHLLVEAHQLDGILDSLKQKNINFRVRKVEYAKDVEFQDVSLKLSDARYIIQVPQNKKLAVDDLLKLLIPANDQKLEIRTLFLKTSLDKAGLIDILLFPEQWNSEDPRIARQLLAEKGIQFTAQELQQLKQQKARPTKLKKTRIEQLSNYFLVLIIVIFVLLLLWKY